VFYLIPLVLNQPCYLQDVDNAKSNGLAEIKAIQPIGTLRQAALEEFTDV
jgi:hypothetical protein